MRKHNLVFAIFYILLGIAQTSVSAKDTTLPRIKDISITGNHLVKSETILHRIPYKAGGVFDEKRSSDALKKLDSFGYFKTIELEKEIHKDQTVSLFISLEEKPLLEKIDFSGNNSLSTHKLAEKIDLSKFTTIDQSSAQQIAQKIKKMYHESDFHAVQVTPEVTISESDSTRATLKIIINEGIKSRVRKVRFIGNSNLEGRKIRSFLATQENWLLGSFSGSGKYDPEQLEMDKQRIAYLYRNIGYLSAQVTHTDIKFLDDNGIDITFTVKEGDRFKISDIDIARDEDIPHEFLTSLFTLRAGDYYSEELLGKTIQNLKTLWGQYGYIDADVHPQVVPDTGNNTVKILFHTEKGGRWKLNKINITGNKITHDSIIRRQIILNEGEIITTDRLEESRNNVEYLSYFERGGVNWKKHRIDKDLVDLELQVKETLTRQFNMGLTFGANKNSPGSGLRGVTGLELRNIGGRGWDAGFDLEGTFKKYPGLSWGRTLSNNLQKAAFHIFDPHIFDTDISGYLNISYNKDNYDQWKDVTPQPQEEIFTLSGRIGFPLPTIDRRTVMSIELGLQDIKNNHDSTSNKAHKKITPIYTHNELHSSVMQKKIDNTFQRGTLHWIGVDVSKDTRNHKVYPNDGYKLSLETKWVPSALNNTFSYIKTEANGSWYTPLIGPDKLVLGLHAYGGLVTPLKKLTHKIPYRELFNLGGQNTIRGFNWGEVAPSFYGMPIGGTKAIQFNAELIFPVLNNYSMKMHLFYDTGCSWDTPEDQLINKYPKLLKKNKFHLRHTVGIGLNIMQPQPMKLSFGYKLDRDKKAGETPHEFHIGMNAAF